MLMTVLFVFKIRKNHINEMRFSKECHPFIANVIYIDKINGKEVSSHGKI